MSLDPRFDPVVHKAEAESLEAPKHKPPKKYARSQAELIAIKQRKWQIVLVSTNVLISALIALKTFGII